MMYDYNKIKPDEDTIEVMQAKINAIKKGYQEGTVTLEELEAEKAKTGAVNYAFTW